MRIPVRKQRDEGCHIEEVIRQVEGPIGGNWSVSKLSKGNIPKDALVLTSKL